LIISRHYHIQYLQLYNISRNQILLDTQKVLIAIVFEHPGNHNIEAETGSWETFWTVRRSLQKSVDMASHVVVIDTTFRRATVKVTPGKYMSDVLEEACEKLNLIASNYTIK